ncbi:MAG TPA: hypothetical protein VH722_03300 [Alphaproteobacteria bacterium]|nr:hypothetical protein [Alphaproteobacteria bacterium]
MRANNEVVVDFDFHAHMGRERALGGVERAMRELAANMIRVGQGNGRPEMIGPQAQALVFALDAHRSIAGRALSSTEVTSVLDAVARTERTALMDLVRGPDMEAPQNLISHALPSGPRLYDASSRAPRGFGPRPTADDYYEDAFATG